MRLRLRTWGAAGTVFAVVAVALPLATAPPAAAAGPGIHLAKSGDSQVLAGESASFTLTVSNPASNPGAAPEYNTSFRDVLPIGVTYQPGSTSPADVGDPTIVIGGGGQQTLIWRDIFDLQKGASGAVTFLAAIDDAVLPVGSSFANTADAFASSAPRYVPRFTAAGLPVADLNVQSATSNTTTTAVTALKITKDEPSPESKLLRGVHDHQTTYTLTVTDTGIAATTGVSVVDFLPASQEFLGCGGVDNTSAGAVEYPGSPPLSAGPTLSAAQCPAPASVDTVTDPVGYPAGLYTKVTWNLGVFAAGQVRTIRYLAAIPLRQNVAFGAGAPSPASGLQTANLDNNTGSSTRQDGDASSSTNTATATGVYTGNVAPATPAAVTAQTTHTVTVNDLRVYKAVSPTEFKGGDVATYTLHVDAGEYTDSTAITVTDVLPNGICPLDNVSNHASGAPAECGPGAGFAPSLAFKSVTQNLDGTFTVVFQPIDVSHNGSTVITYQGRMRTDYTGGSLAGTPTSVGDAFTNHASEAGTSTPVPATGVSDDLSVTDATSATQTTSFGSLTKTVGARATPMTCATAVYGATNPTFVKGDRVCFQVSVTFSTTNQTRNPVLTDFLPDNTVYEDLSVSYPPSNTVPAGQIAFNSTGGALTWTLGSANSDGSLEVAAGSVFVAQFSSLVLDAAAGPAPDKPGNLAKLRTENSTGQATSLRAGVDFQIAAAPPVAITKGVASVDGVPAGGNPANTDHVQVREGSSVVYRVDVTNNGNPATVNDVPVGTIRLWDVLPAGITCADVPAAGISDSGVCTDPGDAGQPNFFGNATLSAIVWTSAPALAPGASRTLTYGVTMPTPLSVSTDLVNIAAVRSFDSTTDLGVAQTFYPSSNVDRTVPIGQWDAPAASDPSDVVVADVAMAKKVASSVNEAGNIGAENPAATSTQATIGETVTYTVSATVPAHTTVFNGRLTDALPTGLAFVSATAGFKADAGSGGAPGALAPGVTFDSSTPSLTFPATYDNTTATDQLFVLTITAQVTQAPTNVQAVVRTNTATFASDTAASGGTAVTARTSSAQVVIVEPSPSLAKTNSAPAGGVAAGQTVTYTLTATDAAGRPPLHNSWLSDCLPAGLTFGAYGTLPGGVTTLPPAAGDGTNGCPSGTTLLAWNIGTLAAGSPVALTYTETVDPSASGKQTYVNNAAVSGNSVSQARTGPTDAGNPAGRQYSVPATNTVTAAGATAAKTVTPSKATIGDTVTYTAGAQVPAGINFYNLSIIDTLPNGIDATSVQQGTVTCTNADATTCSVTSATALSHTAGTGSRTVIGWLFGDVTQTSQARTITISYSARVADVAAATRSAVLSNAAHVVWDNAVMTAPTSAGATFQQTSTNATAAVTVTEPVLSIAKAVSATTPQPGDTFTYTLSVTNSGAANVSPAFNVTVTDAVPVGVVVNPATISGGGTLGGTDGNGSGGTIAWTLAGSIAVGGAAPALTYQATLAPSSTLTAAGLTNTARVTGYDSLTTGGRHYSGPSATRTVTPAFPRAATTKTTPDGQTAYIGISLTWRVNVRNSGGGTAAHVGTVDTLPPSWTYDAGSAVVSVNGAPGSAIEPATTTTAGVQTLTWTELGTLSPGTSLVITYSATAGLGVVSTPGVGLSVNQVNSATSTAKDPTGASGNSTGPYSGGPGTIAAKIASADVRVAKAVGTAPTAGGSGTWTLSVSNSGPDPAVGPFTVADGFNNPVPADVTIITVTGTGWSCVTSVPITCTRTNSADTLANAASFPPITVTYAVASTVVSGAAYSNTATVSARTYDPALGNNSSTAGTTVSTKADLAVAKSLSSPQLVAGQSATYSITAQNLGPSIAVGPVTITDPLPAGTAFDSVSAPGWTCATIAPGTAGATLSCVLGDGTATLGVGQVPNAIAVTVDIPSGRTAAVSNTATIGSPTTDPAPGNNSSTATTMPTVSTDLLIQKQHLTSPFVAGQDADYRIQVRNLGPSDATGVTVTDSLPTGLSYVSFTPTDPGWSCSAAGSLVTCLYTGSLAPSATPTSFVLTVHLDPTFAGPAVNTANVSSTTTDPVPGNNTSTDNSSITTSADLSIDKTHTGAATAGLPLVYTLTVANNGPSVVAGLVTVSDSLPVGLTYASATGTGWACTYDGPTRLITCTLAAGLANGATAAAITVGTSVQASVGPTTLFNTASVSSATPDPNLGNNDKTDTVAVATTAAIAMTKTLATASPVLAGTDATFILAASNSGPSDSSSVLVTDTLPPYLTYKSATGTGWSCASTGQVVTCSRATLAADTTAPHITLIATISPSTPVTLPAGTATLVNNATIDAATAGTRTDPGPVDVSVQAKADLTLVKTPKGAAATAGSSFTWTLAVTNSGPSDAASPLTVTDVLPSYETFVSASGPWDCTADTAPNPPSPAAHQTITCTLSAAVAASASAPQLDLVLLIDATAPAGHETNTATASSPTPGSTGTDSATVTVGRVAALRVTKTHTGNGQVGQPLSFTLVVHNDGPSTADHVVVTDPLPTGLSYDSFAGTGWTCTAVVADATCALAGTLAPGSDSAPLTISTVVGPQAYPSVTNVATVSSTDPDLPGSQNGTDTVTVDPLAQLAITKQHVGTFTVGTDGSYQITVTNTGPTATPGPTTVTDTLPGALSYVGVTGTAWTCAVVAQTVTCSRTGTLASGEVAALTLTVAVGPSAYPSVVNSATATGPGSEPAMATDTAPVTPLVVLAITKTLQSYRDGVATYRITVTNIGPNDTVGPIRVNDALPAGLVLRSASGSDWTCSTAANAATCTYATLLTEGASASVTVVAAVTGAPGSRIDNVANVSGGGSVGSGVAGETTSDPVRITVATGNLPQTGADAIALAELALALLACGAALLLTARRRSPKSRH